MQMTAVQTAPSHRMCVIGMFHQPLPATDTAKPETHAMAKMTRPWASKKLRSLGTRARTRRSAPANHAQPILDGLLRLSLVVVAARISVLHRSSPGCARAD